MHEETTFAGGEGGGFVQATQSFDYDPAVIALAFVGTPAAPSTRPSPMKGIIAREAYGRSFTAYR